MGDRDGATPHPQMPPPAQDPPSSLDYAVRRPNTAAQVRDSYEPGGGRFEHVGPKNAPVDYFRPAGVPQPVVFHSSHAWVNHAAAAAQPSPATYQPKLPEDVVGGFIPKGDRFPEPDPIALAEMQELPGPAHYTLTHTFKDKRMAMKFRAGMRKPPNHGQGGPGPGKYDPAYPHLRNVTRQIKFPCAVRGHGRQRDASPGPCGYNPPAASNRIRGSIRTNAKRPDPYDRPLPDMDAPLQAAPALPSDSTHSIPKAKRGGDQPGGTPGRGVPGPGSYDPSRSAGHVQRGAPAVSFTQAPRTGPPVPTTTQLSTGAYNVEGAAAPRGGSIGKGLRTFEQVSGHAEDPGPAHYDTGRSDRHTRKGVRAFRIAQRTKQQTAAEANPGPGTYDPPVPGTAKPVTVGHGLRVALDGAKATPGPGAYEVGLQGASPKKCLTKIRPLSSSGAAGRDPFGAAGLVGRESADAPFYNIGGGKQATLQGSFSKHGRTAAKAGGAQPGPGQYTPTYRHVGRNGGASALLYLTG
eukprot:TRINITY_DN29667_c0_g1_i1.p1 TRINITY_DN29667_c0_g1~~TRINITY_DN29667_c0_g1_i1.p1  ORF type:complete len:547 (+),score=113.31 TRINITY_DN29667_c0_g1_i1:80-1642(+)